jgi:hypothetical protein
VLRNSDPIRVGIMTILIGGSIFAAFVLLIAVSDQHSGNPSSARMFWELAASIESAVVALSLILMVVFRK